MAHQIISVFHAGTAYGTLDNLSRLCYNDTEYDDGQYRSCRSGTGLTHLAGISSKAGWQNSTTAPSNRPMVDTFCYVLPTAARC